jgi:hypothetical protein
MLAVFTPADWPGRTVLDKLSLWKEARRVYFEEHGWPGGALALLQESSDVQRRLEGRPLLPWSRTPAELAALNGDQYDPRRRWFFDQAPSQRIRRQRRTTPGPAPGCPARDHSPGGQDQDRGLPAVDVPPFA